MIPPTLRKPRWGFKEIWAGSDSFPYGWELYRGAFPNAWYVHSVRHPLDYLRSSVSHSGTAAPDEQGAIYALGQWVAMVRHARTLRSTGRYLEFRMENFDAELPRILEALDLPPHPACTAAAGFRYLPSARRQISVSAGAIDRVEGLRALAEELGYPRLAECDAVHA
jgi:hypothetical protein